MRAQNQGALAVGVRIHDQRRARPLIGGVLYLAFAYFLPSLTWRATWLAWAVGLLVALGGASSYFGQWRAVGRETEAITHHLKDRADR